jgi:nucleotide-binding universal stress UspA family protein
MILAGVDGSPGSRDAAALASALAPRGDTDLLLVAAFHDPLLPPIFTGDVHPERDAAAAAHDVRRTCAPGGQIRTVADISPARALRRIATEERAWLLVLGSAAAAPQGRARAGRTARQVLHAAPCPVAIAARGFRDSGGGLRRVVAGIDGSPESCMAYECARAVASAAGASLTAVAVADDRFPASLMPMGTVVALANWEETVEMRRRHAAELLQELVGTAEVQCAVCVGSVPDQLYGAAENADLLVVGSRRWGMLSRIALGSASEDLAHAAPCSLLVVPRPAAEGRDAAKPATEAATTG